MSELQELDRCSSGNQFNGRIGIRVSAIFVILAGSLFGEAFHSFSLVCPPLLISPNSGAAFPVYAKRHRGVGIPQWVFFILKYFGSGVIIATAFIHVRSQALGQYRISMLPSKMLMG